MRRRAYATDVSERQWELLEPFFLALPGRGGRPPKYPRREVPTRTLYTTRSGCQWRLLPHDFPPWDTVYDSFRRWSEAGLLTRVHAHLRTTVRQQDGRDKHP